jgi:hypothetical protein
MTMPIITHEVDEAGRIACRPTLIADGRPDRALTPGTSTCGHPNCHEIRARVRANSRPSWLVAWPTPFTAAQAYAAKAYSELRNSICPGGQGHEGNGASAEFCDACIANAIAEAYKAGQKWAGY